jgi:hypothetical protein
MQTPYQIRQNIVRDPSDRTKHLLISTVHTDQGPETLVFRVKIDFSEIDGKRYDTDADAEAGHAAFVARLEGA